VSADSIVLERTVCSISCPAYRLRLSRDGSVHFQSRNPGEEQRVATDTFDPAAFGWLLAEAERIEFYYLPGDVARSKAMCQTPMPGYPANITTIYGDATKSVRNYSGCLYSLNDLWRAKPLERLREFESSIDSVAGSQRWIRPLGAGCPTAAETGDERCGVVPSRADP